MSWDERRFRNIPSKPSGVKEKVMRLSLAPPQTRVPSKGYLLLLLRGLSLSCVAVKPKGQSRV